MGLLFNSFVLAVFFAHKDRLTVAEIYSSNLALADFILLCGLPFWAMNILNDVNWPYGDALCKLVNSINFYTSIYTLVMISVDRYLALVKTMKARSLRRTLYAKVICSITWILAAILSMPTMVHRKVKFIKEFETMSWQYFRRKVSAIYMRTRHHRRGSDMTTYQHSVVSTYINRTEQIKAVVIFNAKDLM
ncbi:hypothetical protein VZT92_008917 [Zoarces viviparus]|uniref:G-protein coupled receptors family 1 profile domain-containing protein n=1 Tax=Zoarces viviparus TaxID=48416 RepID=A0AAW1FHV1_ZOAVI